MGILANVFGARASVFEQFDKLDFFRSDESSAERVGDRRWELFESVVSSADGRG